MAYQANKTGLGGLFTEESDLAAHSTDIFSPPPYETAISEGDDVIIHPTTAVQSKGPFEFIISPENNTYTYLPLTRLEGSFKVQKNGVDITEADKVSLVNLAPCALIEQISVTVNGVRVTDSSSRKSYPYKAYMTTQCSYGDGAKKGHLRLAGYLDDSENQSGNVDLDTHPNLKIRSTWIEKSKPYYFSMPLFVDFFQTERFLHCNSEVRINISREKDNFALITKEETNEYEIKIEDLHLSVRRVRLHEGLHESISKNILTEDTIYPIMFTKISNHIIPQGTTNTIIPNLFRGKLPSQIIIGMVKSSSYDGKTNTNPFFFEHFKLNYMSLRINGKSSPLTPYQPNFTTGKVVREARSFYDNTGVLHSNEATITFDRWKNGNTFFAFDLSPDKCSGAHLHDTQNGYIDLQVGFETQLSETVNVIVYSVFNEIISLTGNNETLTTF